MVLSLQHCWKVLAFRCRKQRRCHDYLSIRWWRECSGFCSLTTGTSLISTWSFCEEHWPSKYLDAKANKAKCEIRSLLSNNLSEWEYDTCRTPCLTAARHSLSPATFHFALMQNQTDNSNDERINPTMLIERQIIATWDNTTHSRNESAGTQPERGSGYEHGFIFASVSRLWQRRMSSWVHENLISHFSSLDHTVLLNTCIWTIVKKQIVSRKCARKAVAARCGATFSGRFVHPKGRPIEILTFPHWSTFCSLFASHIHRPSPRSCSTHSAIMYRLVWERICCHAGILYILSTLILIDGVRGLDGKIVRSLYRYTRG